MQSGNNVVSNSMGAAWNPSWRTVSLILSCQNSTWSSLQLAQAPRDVESSLSIEPLVIWAVSSPWTACGSSTRDHLHPSSLLVLHHQDGQLRLDGTLGSHLVQPQPKEEPTWTSHQVAQGPADHWVSLPWRQTWGIYSGQNDSWET